MVRDPLHSPVPVEGTEGPAGEPHQHDEEPGKSVVWDVCVREFVVVVLLGSILCTGWFVWLLVYVVVVMLGSVLCTGWLVW